VSGAEKTLDSAGTTSFYDTQNVGQPLPVLQQPNLQPSLDVVGTTSGQPPR